jgi:Spy/CpxP family protein refolding chaperone
MSRLFVVSAFLFSLAFAVPSAVACGPGGCANKSGCGAGPCPMAAANGIFGVQGDFYFTALINAKEIGLANDQVAALKKRYFDNRKQLDGLSEKMQDAQRRLEALLADGGTDQEQVENVLAEMSRLKGEMRVNIQKTVEDGQALLTEAQRQKLWQIVSGAPAADDHRTAS